MIILANILYLYFNEYQPGDVGPHAQWEETASSQLACTEILVSSMESAFNETTRVLPCIGNHGALSFLYFNCFLTCTAIARSQCAFQHFVKVA